MAGTAAATTLRIVTYNIDDDTGGSDQTDARTNMTDLGVILQAIGNEHLVDGAQPIDVLALNELHNDGASISSSLPAIVSVLNGIYGAGTYAYDTYVGTTDGTTLSGNGPNGLIYNTHTVQDLGAVGLTTEADGVTPLVSGSAAPRQPIRYLLAPVGYGANADFYLYSSHYKSGSTSQTRRQLEADAIRANSDALGSSAHIIYTGDFNLTGSSTLLASNEPAYLDLKATGNGQANDPGSLPNWDNTSAFTSILTEAGSSLFGRYDFQLASNAMLNQPGMQLVPSSYTVFGQSSGTVFNDPVNISSNHALSDLSNQTQVLNLLSDETDVTDHLPVVADYTTVGISPLPNTWLGGTGNWSTTAKWSTLLVPNDPGVEVKIDNGNATASVVTLDQTETVEDVTLDTNDKLIISSGKTLTIDGPNGSVLTGTLNNSGTLAITGGTTQILANSTQGGTFTVSTGATLKFNGTLGSASLTSNGSTLFAANASTGILARTFSSLSIGSAGSVTVTAATQTAGPTVNPNRTVLVTPSLTVTGTGTLNLNNNDMIVQGVGVTGLAAITSQIAHARNTGSGGLWTGTGITSSSAAVTANNTALGVELNSDGSENTLVSNFDGKAVINTDVLVKYTYAGDANLDGVVNGSDYTLIDNSFNSSAPATWRNGDFNYDGKINGDDYILIDNSFNSEGSVTYAAAPVAPTEMVATNTSQVPEPATSVLLIVSSVGLLARRRRLAR
jgi:endonuclease/exonuclease/phosphatase family metal-dependent hydrolase